MAGKSTFLRQNALIPLLAQTGSFVPASHATLGLSDRLFTRLGAADDLSRDQSTFMLEMRETAHILQHATPRSLVIMDEVGRGTTPTDGTAVAFACLHHLHDVVRCRALFATHFHRLADMARDRGLRGVAAWCSDVVEGEGGRFAYRHRLRPGVNRRSHALKVARVAGVPESAVRVAEEVLVEMGREEERRVVGGDGGGGGGEVVHERETTGDSVVSSSG